MVKIRLEYLLLGFAFLVALLFALRLNAVHTLNESSEDFTLTKERVIKIARLKSEWDANPAARSRVNNLFSNEALRSKGTVQQTQTGIKAELRGIDAQTVTMIFRQLLESQVNVKSFVIERVSEESTSVTVEILW